MSADTDKDFEAIAAMSMAESWFAQYQAFLAAGYTPEQAFELNLATYKTSNLVGTINKSIETLLEHSGVLARVRELLDQDGES